jgi:hypothetical protein
MSWSGLTGRNRDLRAGCREAGVGGVVETEPNIRNKLARGEFTAVFLIQCLEAIGASSLRLSDC